MENSKKNVIITQETKTVDNSIDFVKEFNDLKNNKIVQIAVTAIISVVKRRKNESKLK